MTLIRTNRDKYAELNTVLPGVRRVVIEGDNCLDTPTIASVSLINANTEMSYTLPEGTVMFRFKSSRGQKLSLRYKADGPVYTIPLKTEYCLTGVCTEVTLFLSSPKSNVIVEIESWANTQ